MVVADAARDSSLEFDLLRIKHEGTPPPQNEFFHDRADHALYYGGVGIGKTFVLVADGFQYADDWPGSRQIISEPTFPMIRDILLPTIDEVYGPLEGLHFEMVRSAPQEIRFANGSEIWLRSTDTNPERLRGPNIARVLMDEISIGAQEDARNMFAARLRQKMPSGDFYPHQLKATGTPKGMNWFHRDYIAKPLPDTRVFFAHTRDAERAGTLPPGFVDRLIATYGGIDAPLARQELEGAFLRMAGPVFPQFGRDRHVRTWDGSPLKDILGGIDPGGVSPTALVVGGLRGDGRVHAIAEWYKHEAGLDGTVEAMANLERETGVRLWIIDPSATEWMTKLNNAGLRVRKARHGNDLKLRVQLVGARLNVRSANEPPGLFIAHSCPNLITELEGLMWYRVRVPGKAEEQLRDRFEQGTPDHAFDALANIIAEWDGLRQAPPDVGPIATYGAAPVTRRGGRRPA